MSAAVASEGIGPPRLDTCLPSDVGAVSDEAVDGGAAGVAAGSHARTAATDDRLAGHDDSAVHDDAPLALCDGTVSRSVHGLLHSADTVPAPSQVMLRDIYCDYSKIV